MIKDGEYPKWEWISRDTEETAAFGRLLASQLLADDVVSLDGDLGAGKTVLTRGLASGLGITGNIVSPTFTILVEYTAGTSGLPLFHFDAYRLAGSDDFYAGGFDEFLSMGGLSVIEWGRIIADAMPEQTLYIWLYQIGPEQPDQRRILVEWPFCPERLNQLKKTWEESRGI
jgi:tRNA threonylcarbamoyladenosine biosynthesis protein TsaE